MPLPRRHTPRQPNPHPFPDIQAPPRPSPSCTATSSQPPSGTPLVLSYRPVPLPHYALAPPRGRRTHPCPCSGIPPPSPSLPLSFKWALGPEAPRAPPRPLPSQTGGGARFFYSGSAGTRPLLRMLNAPWEEGAGPSGQHWAEMGWGYRAILRNILIRELRLPFNPTGRHCLNGRSTQKGEKGTN